MGDLQVSPLRRAGKGLSFDILGLIDRRHLGHVLLDFTQQYSYFGKSKLKRHQKTAQFNDIKSTRCIGKAPQKTHFLNGSPASAVQTFYVMNMCEPL